MIVGSASVEKKDRELDVLDEQIETLERGGARTDDSLEREADASRSRAEEAERLMNLQTQELEALKETLERHVSETRESKRSLDEARARAARAEDDVKEMQERLANETRKMQAKMREDTTAAQRASQRNQEVSRYQKENAMLGDENARLSGKIEELMAECVGYSETIVRLDDAAQGWRGKEADVEAAAESLRRERDMIAAQLETSTNDLHDRTVMLQTFEQRFSEEHELWRVEREDLEDEVRKLNTAVSMERERSSNNTRPGTPSDGNRAPGLLASPRRRANVTRASQGTHNAANGLHPDDPRYVEELEAEVKELRDLRVLLLEAYDQLEKDVGREIDIALQRQNRHHAALEAKVGVQDEALRQESKRFTELDRALRDAQDELADLTKRNAQYEAGVYGLSEAMRDLKGLRLQIRSADAQVQDAVDVSNGLGRKVEDLTEETRFLRQKAGIPEDATIDLGDFKLRSKVEAAQLRALNQQLEHEVMELEEDRRRLRNELRYRAKWQGEHAAKLGLSARQLAMLEEFADALRFGQETSFQVQNDDEQFSAQRAVEHINARAVNELEEANRHLQERLAETLERAHMGGINMSMPVSGAVSARAPGPAPDYGAQQPQPQPYQETQFAQQQHGQNQDNVAAAAAMLAAQQQTQFAQQQQTYQQQQQAFTRQMFVEQQEQLRRSFSDRGEFAAQQQPMVIHERVIERGEVDAAATAQIAELQRQLQRARGEIVRLEDGYHDAMTRSSQNFQSASAAAATQAAAMAAATQAAAFAAMAQLSRPSTPPPAPVSAEPSRPASPMLPSMAEVMRRSADTLLSKQRVRLQEKLAEVTRLVADSDAAAVRAAENAEAAKKHAELVTDTASREANAAAVTATSAALAEAQRVASAAAAAAAATSAQFEQARAKEQQAGQVALEKAEETRVAQLEAEQAVRRAEDEARSAARRAEEEARVAARQAEEDARYARDQARSLAEDTRIARNAAQALETQNAFAAQSRAAGEALAEAQRAAMAATRAAKSAAKQLEEARARQAVVPASLPTLVPTPAPVSAPVPVESEQATTPATTAVETIALASPVVAAPATHPPVAVSEFIPVPVTINVAAPVPERPPPSPRRTSGSQTLDLPPAFAAPAPTPAPAVAVAPAPAPYAPPVDTTPISTQVDFPEEDVVALADYANAIAAVDRLRAERDETRVRVRQLKATASSDEREIYELKTAVAQLGERAQMAHQQMTVQAHTIEDMSVRLAGTPSGGQPSVGGAQGAEQAPVSQQQPPSVALFDVPSLQGPNGAPLSESSSTRLREECAAADRALAVLASDLQSKEVELEQLASEVSRYDAAMREMGRHVLRVSQIPDDCLPIHD